MATPTAPEGAVQALYTAAACSRNHASAARPQDGLVAFASGHSVALWKSAVRPLAALPDQLARSPVCLQDEHSAGVHQTLPGHRGDVTALRFVQSQAQSDCFVSGDAQGEVRVWREKDGKVRIPAAKVQSRRANLSRCTVDYARPSHRSQRLDLCSRGCRNRRCG